MAILSDEGKGEGRGSPERELSRFTCQMPEAANLTFIGV